MEMEVISQRLAVLKINVFLRLLRCPWAAAESRSGWPAAQLKELRLEKKLHAPVLKSAARVSALDAPAEPRRLGFLKGKIEVPDARSPGVVRLYSYLSASIGSSVAAFMAG
jgi:hypothetical protein